jgi:hypothetical protein
MKINEFKYIRISQLALLDTILIIHCPEYFSWYDDKEVWNTSS